MDRTKMQAQRKLTQLAGGTTLALLLGSGAVLAETQGCALVNGVGVRSGAISGPLPLCSKSAKIISCM